MTFTLLDRFLGCKISPGVFLMDFTFGRPIGSVEKLGMKSSNIVGEKVCLRDKICYILPFLCFITFPYKKMGIKPAR